MIIRVFDLDGTLVDSEEAVRAAYADCGITMPAEAWGLPWQAWLPQAMEDAGMAPQGASALHEAKGRAYFSRMAGVRLLPPRRTLLEGIRNENHDITCILSGASSSTILAYLEIWKLKQYVRLVRGSLTLDQRIETLRLLQDLHRPAEGGEIFDDNIENCRMMRAALDTDFWAIYHYLR